VKNGNRSKNSSSRQNVNILVNKYCNLANLYSLLVTISAEEFIDIKIRSHMFNTNTVCDLKSQVMCRSSEIHYC